ncbi:hypothetical protein AX15_007473, partial [Amanita polypyramis BW_CC]
MVTLCGDWSLTFSDALTLPDLEQLQSALDAFHHPGAEVVNCPTSASLKFPHVPTIHPDGSAVSDSDLLEALRSHPRWRDVSFVTPPRFIWPAVRPGDLSALVFCEVRDSQASSSTCSLLKSTPGSLTGPLPSAPPVAGGVTRPTSAGLTALGVLHAPAPTSPCCTPLQHYRTHLSSRSSASTALGPTQLHH